MDSNNHSYFADCYYGCKLDANTLRWKYKIFNKVKDADEFALENRNQSLCTKLVNVKCLYKKNGYEVVLKTLLSSRLQFETDLEK